MRTSPSITGIDLMGSIALNTFPIVGEGPFGSSEQDILSEHRSDAADVLLIREHVVSGDTLSGCD